VHFFIDGLDLSSVASKTDGHGRSVTASELRWLYRHRYMPDARKNLVFWKNYKKLSQEDVFSLPLWQAYRPKKIYLNRPDFPGECFICELRLSDHCFRWKHNKLFLLLPEEYGPA
ncbi:hypothetical protein ABTY52_27280, partial [Escherichia coli]